VTVRSWKLFKPVLDDIVQYDVMPSKVHYLNLWGPRDIWPPWDVLTCPDICVFFSCL